MPIAILTPFESAVLKWIAETSDDLPLQEQVRRAVLRGREHTGVGCYVTIAVPLDAPESTAAYSSRGPLAGPSFESPAVEHGGGTLLWFEAGRACCLEIYAFAERFPVDHSELGDFRLLPG